MIPYAFTIQIYQKVDFILQKNLYQHVLGDLAKKKTASTCRAQNSLKGSESDKLLTGLHENIDFVYRQSNLPLLSSN